MFKKPKVDEESLFELRREFGLVSTYDSDSKTDVGKRLIYTLEETIQDTVREFALKEIEKFDTDAKLIFFLASCRSKLQTLMALKKMYAGAEQKKKELGEELERLLPPLEQ